MSKSTFLEFVREHVPAPPARVLDVGCGQGELTTSLAIAGYDVLGIDPLAPPGEYFRRLKLEDVEETERFDAVVAGFSLHHVSDLETGLDKIARLLQPGGVLVVDEFGWDRLDETTLDWLYGQQRALAAAGHGEPPASHGRAAAGVGGGAPRPARVRRAACGPRRALRRARVRVGGRTCTESSRAWRPRCSSRR